jgi:hypothetical protein
MSDVELKRALAHGINAIHDCLDGFRAEQAAENEDARHKRHRMANTIASVQGSVRALYKRIGALEADATTTKGSVKRLSKMFGAEPVEEGEKPPKGRGVATWSGWKVIAAIFASLGGVVLAYKIAFAVLKVAAPALHHALMTAAS